MSNTRTLFVLYILVESVYGSVSHQPLTYSFRRPKEWGALTVEEAECCPLLTYPENITSEQQIFPHFLGLGTMKSGSTALSKYLDANPDFTISRRKESYFLMLDYQKHKTMQSYERLWDSSSASDTVRFEFTPCYLWVPFTPCRVKEVLPNMKFVVILRNPVDRAYSEYNMIRGGCKGDDEYCIWRKLDYFDVVRNATRALHSTGCSFNKGDGEKTWNDCFRCLIKSSSFRKNCHNRGYYFKLEDDKKMCFDFGYHLITHGLYAAQLAWWFSFFDPNNFVVLLTHDFHKDPVKGLNRIRDKVGMGQPFTLEMLPKEGQAVMNQGNYRFADIYKEDAKGLLSNFFARPNLELYNLLDETNLGPFTPFDQIADGDLLNDTKLDALGITNGLRMVQEASLVSKHSQLQTVSSSYTSVPLFVPLSLFLVTVILCQFIVLNRRTERPRN